VAGALAEERVDWSSIQVDPSGSPKNRNLSKEHVRTFAEHTTGPGTPALGSDVCRDIGATVSIQVKYQGSEFATQTDHSGRDLPYLE